MRDVGYGVGPATSIWPRISPPGKSPGPVLVGATPSFVCTLAYAPAVDSAAIRSLRGWATKLLASGTRAASARNASGRCGSVGGLRSQLVLTVTRNSAAVETTTGRMEASRVKSSVLVYLCPRGSQGRGGYPSVIVILPHGPSPSDQPDGAPPLPAQSESVG